MIQTGGYPETRTLPVAKFSFVPESSDVNSVARNGTGRGVNSAEEIIAEPVLRNRSFHGHVGGVCR